MWYKNQNNNISLIRASSGLTTFIALTSASPPVGARLYRARLIPGWGHGLPCNKGGQTTSYENNLVTRNSKESLMEQPTSFHQALQTVIKRATVKHLQATGRMLSLQIIAQEVGLDVTSLQLVLRGKALLESSYLLPLLVYLGCNEAEQRFIFHLAEIAAERPLR